MFLGTIQMILIVSIVYWLVIPLTGVIVTFTSDPLGRRRGRSGNWRPRKAPSDPAAELRRQG
jgi:hypothetical protein